MLARVPSQRPGRMTIVGISPSRPEARAIIGELDAEIASRNPGSPINGIDVVDFEGAGGYFVLAEEGGTAIGCGAFRPVDARCAEIKRMFVRPAARKRGVARAILRHLEDEAWRRGFLSIVLETGHRHTEALSLYESEGYFPIPPFLGYVGSPISRCFAKGSSHASDAAKRSTRA
jgi:putative acetyltransferase